MTRIGGNLTFERMRLLGAALCFGLLAAVYYGWTWSPVLTNFGGDNAYYLLTAQHFSPYSAHSEVAEYFATRNHYPPFYPLVLALFGGGESITAAHILTTTFILLSFVVFMFWLRLEGTGYWQAFAAALILALLPGSYFHALPILSESLYLLITLLAAALVGVSEKRLNVKYLWLAALAIGLASITRGVGLAAVLAYVLYLSVSKLPGRWITVLPAILPFVAWKLFGYGASRSYFDYLLIEYGADPFATLFSNMQSHGVSIFYGWVSNFYAVGEHLVLVLAFIGMLCLLGLLYRVYLKKYDALYTLIYLSIVWIWPFSDEAKRLVFVVVPFLLYNGIFLLGSVMRLAFVRRYKNLLQAASVVAMLTIVLPDLVFTYKRFAEPIPEALGDYRRLNNWYLYDKRAAFREIVLYAELTKDMKSLARGVPAGECIYSIKPSVTGIYANRISMPPPGSALTQEAFAQEMDDGPCRYIYMLPFTGYNVKTRFYPLERAEGNMDVVNVLKTQSGMRLPAAAYLGVYKGKE